MRVAVIGGGAAGYFSALSVKEHHPSAEVHIFEKSNKVLAKVRISGGGRCNVCNGNTSIKVLSDAYPRGGKLMKKLLHEFSTKETMEWFESRGVPLYVQEDMRVFPKSDDSRSVIRCLSSEVDRLGIEIRMSTPVTAIQTIAGHIELHTSQGAEIFNKVIVACGGSPKIEGLQWLADLGHEIAPPVPSLFTFNLPNEPVTELTGLVAPEAMVSIQGTKLRSQGPLLITHWGMSGPAILLLSAWGARELERKKYDFGFQVNWTGIKNEDEVRQLVAELQSEHPGKQIGNVKAFDFAERLWYYLLDRAEIARTKVLSELGKKGLNKLINTLCHDAYHAKGKTTFKEEFVTCGGVSLESIHHKTMESKTMPGLYFAGEVLDIDGITGGYNFQAAWTTAFVAGRLGDEY